MAASPAEEHLTQILISFLNSHETDSSAHQILNAGAGQSVVIEKRLLQAGCRYVCDRIDIEDCNVDFPTIGKCWQCSIEEMRPLSPANYIAVFSNFVLEHVENIKGASQEIYRVLAPGGLFIATIPNSMAPEFLVARHTPLWFHKLIRRTSSWETKYSYKSIPELLDMFLKCGFQVKEEKRWPTVGGYPLKYPIIRTIGKLYDNSISAFKCRGLMGNACIVLQKPT
jgi:hypothetical protein